MTSFERIKNSFLYKCGLRIPYSRIRVKALRALGHSVGGDVYFPADITITQNFDGERGMLTLGDRVSIGPRCIFIIVSHPNFSNIRSSLESKAPFIIIENDVWIGAGVIVLPGLTIGEGSVVGAGAVVTKSVPAHTVVAGNPARIIRHLDVVNTE